MEAAFKIAHRIRLISGSYATTLGTWHVFGTAMMLEARREAA
jgi:hypothetical protein